MYVNMHACNVYVCMFYYSIINGFISHFSSHSFLKHPNPNALLQVFYNGSVKYTQLGQVHSICFINLNNFPYDVQKCDLVIGTLLSDTSQISFDVEEPANFKLEAGEWMVENINIKYDHVLNVVVYRIVVSRKPLYYVVTVIIPVAVLSLLGGLVFYIPAGYGDKLSFSMTVLLSFTIFQIVLVDKLPEKSESFPLLGKSRNVKLLSSVSKYKL